MSIRSSSIPSGRNDYDNVSIFFFFYKESFSNFPYDSTLTGANLHNTCLDFWEQNIFYAAFYQAPQ